MVADVARDQWQKGVTLKGVSIGLCDGIITAILLQKLTWSLLRKLSSDW